MRKNLIVIWVIWLLASLFYAFQYILRVLPNLLVGDILDKFQIDAGVFGQFSGLYYVGYALAHIPLGILLDRYGTKKVIPSCVLITVVGLAPLVYSNHWVYPCIGRFLLGVGSSAAILGTFKIILYCFGKEKFTRMLGISVVIGLCGAIFGGMPLSILIEMLSWQDVVKCAMLAGVALAVTMYLILPNNVVDDKAEKTTVLHDLKLLFTNSKVIVMCLLAGLMIGPLEGFADVWASVFFKASYDISKTTADGLPSFIFWGMLLGSPLLSFICEKTGKYFEVVIASAVILGGSFVLILAGMLPVSTLFATLFIVGVFCAYQIPIIFKISTFLPVHMMGLATAFVNMVMMTFGYVFHTIIGEVLNATSSGAYESGVPVYTQHDFVYALSIIPIGQVIAALGFIIILQRMRRSEENNLIVGSPA